MDIQTIEEKRKGYITLWAVIWLLWFLCVVSIWGINGAGVEERAFLILLVSMFIYPASCLVITRYKSVIKSFYINNAFTKNYGLKYYNPNPNIFTNILASMGQNIPPVHMDSEEIRDLSLFKNFEQFSFDDYIKGTYKGLNLEIQEMTLSTFITTGKSTASAVSFHGLLLSCSLNKKTKGKTIFYKNHGIFNVVERFLGKSSSAQEVKLEDVEFEKEFKTFSTDQINARYLFTPSFMERLKELSKSKKDYEISGEFLNGKLYLAISCGKNFFEFPFFRSAYESEIYENVLADLEELLKIVDTLKLEENIGL